MPLILDSAELLENLLSIGDYLGDRIEKIGGGYAFEMQSYAKENAPWTDRTGRARRTLTGFCERSQNDFKIGVMGMMPYSPRLELGFSGKYAILTPTLDKYAFEIYTSVSEVIYA